MLFEKALDQMEQGIVITNEQSIVQFINKSGEKILCIKGRDVLNQSTEDVFYTIPNEICLLKRTIDEKKEFTCDVMPHKCGNQDIFLRVETRLLKEMNRIIGAMAIFSDITDFVMLLPQYFFKKLTTGPTNSLMN